MNLKRFEKQLKLFGIALIAIGIFIIIIQPSSPTGAVIDISSDISRIWFFIGIGLLGIGIFLFAFGEKWVEHKTNLELDEILENINENTIFVLDTSGVNAYKPEMKKLIESVKGRVYAPRRVIDELKKSPRYEGLLKHVLTKENIKQLSPRIDAQAHKWIKGYRTMAREALEKTRKHKDYLKLKQIIETGEKPKSMYDEDYRDYLVKIENEINEELYKKKKEINKKNQLDLLKRHYRVSKADLDVLTTALTIAKIGKDARVLAEDTHLRDAIEKLINQDRTLKPHLSYVNYASYENQYERA